MPRARKKPVVLPAYIQWYNWVGQLDMTFPRDGKFIEPLSERWRQARRGRLTASERAIIIAERHPPMWNKLMDRLDAELLPTYQWEEIHAPALDWGRHHEPEALANITLTDGDDITDPGLIFHRKYPFVAATPDGIIEAGGKRISVQIKCPYNSANHLATLYGKALKPVYHWQVLWEGWVAEADEIRFYSYDPRQPAATQLARVDIQMGCQAIDIFEKNVQDFATLYSEGKRLAEGKLSALGIPDF